MKRVHYERPCTGRHCAECTVTAWDLLGADPDFTGGLSVDEYMDAERGQS